MAYPYVCDACLDGRHEECEEKRGRGYGVGWCVCGGADHDPENGGKFVKSLWGHYLERK